MLNFLSQGNQKQVVGISLTPGIGLEAVVLDKNKNAVLNYGRRKIDYNFSTREVEDYLQLKVAIVELMDELKIPAKTLTYIVLPNVYFDFTQVPKDVTPSELKTIILSKAEEFYLFKREEPISGYHDTGVEIDSDTKKVVYTSFQKTAVDTLKEIINDIGLELIGIETAYSATIRGLYFTGQIDDLVSEDLPWSLLLVNLNSYTLFNMQGRNLVDCSEVPLAIKSFSTEEAYQAIVSSASQLLNNFVSSKLFILSQTDDICSDVLKRQMQYDKEIVAIDSNKYSKKPMVDVMQAADFNDANFLTASALGAASIIQNFITLNVLSGDPFSYLGVYFTAKIAGNKVDVTKEFVMKSCFAIALVIALFFGVLVGICNLLNSVSQNKYSEYNSETQSLDAQINGLQTKEEVAPVNILSIIDDLANLNVVAINFYDSIATDIPKNVWLTQYYNKSGDKIVIKGIAENITDIYEYYKNLRVVSPQSNIKLTELKVLTDPTQEQEKYVNNLLVEKDFDRLYTFEIANTEMNMIGASQSSPNMDNSEIEIIKRKPMGQDSNNQQGRVDTPSSQMRLAR